MAHLNFTKEQRMEKASGQKCDQYRTGYDGLSAQGAELQFIINAQTIE